jgi:cytochrome c550
MNPIKAFLSIFAAGILLTVVLAIIGSPKSPEEIAEGGQGETVEISAFVNQTCSSCHGADLKGGAAGGPNLVGIQLSKEEIMKIVKEGQGAMPGGLAGGREEEVADYLLTLTE